MDLESPWSDFYDLLLQDETSHSETEDEWTSVQKTARGQIECQSMSTTMDDTAPVDPEFQTFVNQVLATVSSSPPVSQRHYHFHHHNHRSEKSPSSNWTRKTDTTTATTSSNPLSPHEDPKKTFPIMPGTFINKKNPLCPYATASESPSKGSLSTATNTNTAANTTTTTTTRFMDIHAWITSIAFLAHLLLLWFRP
ncbi:hypothetical protein BCR42DRAFT_443761 [Absidia repens]|uniref:Uncharacterized protein n=1 Tax=Absidia repens TaxID=90262 RepID=A0A1X2HYL8_9FUNG|nr:hypothetical protein BCR42DRAFT_443761 [Absidia repens]